MSLRLRTLVPLGTLVAVALALLPTAPQRATAAADPLAYEHYIGALHEHSGYSDGWPGSRPADYFASAKSFGNDFLGSGEHSDNADLPVTLSEYCLSEELPECAVADKENPADSLRKWDATLEQARAATDDGFTGFRGFEWSSDRFGHINVYFSQKFTNAYRDGGFVSMDTFWNWFTRPPALGGGADGLATFNHPGDKKLSESDPAFNWNNFAYVPAADARMVGLEVFNGTKDFVTRGWYTRALDKGWHVGAIGAEDKGHDKTDRWGAPEWAKTVVVARDRSEASLREAMLSRRFYAVLDNDVRIEMSAGGRPMGSRIGAAEGSTVPISASATPGAERLEIVSNGGEVVAAATGSNISYDAPVTATERYYFVRVIGAGEKPVAYSSPVWISAGDGASPAGEWVAGDFHVHTCYSHDVYCGPSDDNTGPEDFYTVGSTVQMQFCAAAAKGLDFLAITDHNDVRSQTDPGFGACGVMPVKAYENSLRGHAQMIGADHLYSDGDGSAAAVNHMVDELHSHGGAFQVNHPAEGSVDYPHDADWGYGYDVIPDATEVWNISRLWQPPAPSASSNDDAIRYWEGWLDRGYKIAATGGSDNHYVSTQAVQGVGQPTTWVFVTERSQRGIVDAIRSGRTFVSHQPPSVGGPRVYLEGDEAGDGRYEAMVGDVVPPGADLRVRVGGAPGSMLRVLTDGGELAFEPVPVTSPDFEHRFSLPEGATWARAEIFDPDLADERGAACDGAFGSQTTYCRNQLLVLGMTSAIFFDEAAPAPTSLTQPAPVSGVTTDSVEVSTTLTSEEGPLADRVVTFELGSKSVAATTDSLGVARAVIDLTDAPGTYELAARFDCDEGHAASEARTPFEIVRETTSLTYAGDTRAKGETVRLAAVLGEDDGPKVAGRTVTFAIGGRTIPAVTDDGGRAEATAVVPDHGRRQTVTATFDGDATYAPSQTSATVSWGAAERAEAPAYAPVATRIADSPRSPREEPTSSTLAFPALMAAGLSLGLVLKRLR